MAMAAGPYATQLGWPQDVKIFIRVDFSPYTDGYMKNLISIRFIGSGMG
jgi:hypothetical protein